MIAHLIQFHNHLFFALHELAIRSDIIAALAYAVAEYMDVYIILLALLFIGFQSLRKISHWNDVFSWTVLKEGTLVTISVAITYAVTFVLKTLVAAPRPFLAFPDLTPLFVYGGYTSFPSGHAAFFAAIGMMIFFFHKRAGIFFLVWALLIGLSRVIVGIHFPIDILVGWILGAFVSLMVYRIARCRQ